MLVSFSEIVPSVGTGIKAYIPVEDLLAAIIVPSVGTGIKAKREEERENRTLYGYGD